MDTLTAAPRPAVGGVRAALVVAVLGSAMAGLVHAVAARAHDGDPTLMRLFVLCAAAQGLWAVVAMARHGRRVLAAGLILNGGALLVWALTRTVGIPFVSSLAEVEAVGTQDLAGALFAAASVAGAVRMLVQPVARVAIAPAWAGALAVVALLGTMPALKADHDHGDHTHLTAGAHDHAAGTADHPHDEDDPDHAHDADDPEHAHDADDPAHADDPEHAHDETDPGHAHDPAAEGELAGHDHGATDGTGTTAPHAHPTTPGEPTHEHPPTTPGDPPPTHEHPPTTEGPHEHPEDPVTPSPTGPIISVDDPRLTSAQKATAKRLIAEVQAAMGAYPNVAAVEAAGYTSIGDGGTDGYEHYVKWAYLSDGYELNPSRIESIVVKKSSTGAKTIVSGMYILSFGKTMANVPALAGELTTWHDHQNLCFEGTRLVGLSVNGVCARGVLTPTPPMLHVWLVSHPCGPFAGIDSHGGSCGTHEH